MSPSGVNLDINQNALEGDIGNVTNFQPKGGHVFFVKIINEKLVSTFRD